MPHSSVSTWGVRIILSAAEGVKRGVRTRGLPPSDGRRPRPPAAVCRSFGVCASMARPTGGGGLLCSGHAVVATCSSAGVVVVFQCVRDRNWVAEACGTAARDLRHWLPWFHARLSREQGMEGGGFCRSYLLQAWTGPRVCLPFATLDTEGCKLNAHAAFRCKHAAIRSKHAAAGRQGEHLLLGWPQTTQLCHVRGRNLASSFLCAAAGADRHAGVAAYKGPFPFPLSHCCSKTVCSVILPALRQFTSPLHVPGTTSSQNCSSGQSCSSRLPIVRSYNLL